MRLHVGCGPNPKKGHLGLDIHTYGRDDIRRADLEKLPYPFKENSIDSIFAENIIEHLDKKLLPAIMREFYRILRPKGVLFIGCPHFTSPAYYYIQHTGAFGTVEEAKFWLSISPIHSHYDMAFSLRKQRIVFVKKLPWNWIVEPLINLHPLIQKFYENSVLRALFPAAGLHIWFVK